jgi:hypothetical protein
MARVLFGRNDKGIPTMVITVYTKEEYPQAERFIKEMTKRQAVDVFLDTETVGEQATMKSH